MQLSHEGLFEESHVSWLGMGGEGAQHNHTTILIISSHHPPLFVCHHSTKVHAHSMHLRVVPLLCWVTIKLTSSLPIQSVQPSCHGTTGLNRSLLTADSVPINNTRHHHLDEPIHEALVHFFIDFWAKSVLILSTNLNNKCSAIIFITINITNSTSHLLYKQGVCLPPKYKYVPHYSRSHKLWPFPTQPNLRFRSLLLLSLKISHSRYCFINNKTPIPSAPSSPPSSPPTTARNNAFVKTPFFDKKHQIFDTQPPIQLGPTSLEYLHFSSTTRRRGTNIRGESTLLQSIGWGGGRGKKDQETHNWIFYIYQSVCPCICVHAQLLSALINIPTPQSPLIEKTTNKKNKKQNDK